MSLPEEIVDDVMMRLKGRKGFDWWWGDLEEEIQEEIEADLTRCVTRRLERVILH